MLFASSAFSLGVGDFLTILGMVAGGSGFVVYRLTRVPIQIEHAMRSHETRCRHYTPQGLPSQPDPAPLAGAEII